MCFNFPHPDFLPPLTKERKKLVNILKSTGLTLTTSRIHLLHYLTQTTIPLTAFDLSKLVGAPLSTIHRNLSTLADFRVVDYIVDRSGVCRWFLVNTERANFCPTCNQAFNVVY
ncbi:helix-turn-helix domain-containing protein [Buttiauxella noackiae]|uniref:helix-turn-helix domain-containing protein n=1 Tax=Buttiauxella noackiae TaxID=82992 RepID=UPI0012EEBE71